MSGIISTACPTPCVPVRKPPICRSWAEWFIGDLTAVESLHAVAGWIAEGNHFGCATLVCHGGSFPPYRNSRIF